MSIITVRQTLDPFRGANIEYASRKVTLEANGDLILANIGVRKPRDLLVIYKGKYIYLQVCHEEVIPALTIKKYTSETDEPILSVILANDLDAAHHRIVRAKQIKYLKGLFSRAWTWLASPLCSATSGRDSSQINLQASPQNLKSYFSGLRSSVLTCVQQKGGGGYVKLEEDMIEK